MWSWVWMALVVYHLVRWPLDLWWMVWVLAWLQTSALVTFLPCYPAHPQGRWIFKTMLALAFIFSLGLWINDRDIYAVLIVTTLTVVYGAASYHNLVERCSPLQRSSSLKMRAWPVWNILHRYYQLEVWRERRHRIASNDPQDSGGGGSDNESPIYDSIDVLFRLWMVSCKPEDYYKRWPMKPTQRPCTQTPLPNKERLPSLWIAHPHGSGSTSILLAFAFQGTCVDTSYYGPIVVAVDDGYFAVPIMREMLLCLGCISAQRECIKKALLDGNSVVVAPGLYAESLKATFSTFSIHTDYTTEILALGHEYGTPIRPLVVLGENESISAFRWWDQVRSWIWMKWSVRLPGITWPIWTPHRYLVVGRPITNNRAQRIFYQRWLTLFDESRCALRRTEAYYKCEGSEDESMALLRAQCSRPLQPRVKKTLYRKSPTTQQALEEFSVV